MKGKVFRSQVTVNFHLIYTVLFERVGYKLQAPPDFPQVSFMQFFS